MKSFTAKYAISAGETNDEYGDAAGTVNVQPIGSLHKRLRCCGDM